MRHITNGRWGLLARAAAPLLTVFILGALLARPSPCQARRRYPLVSFDLENGLAIPSHDGYGSVGYALRGSVSAGGNWFVLPFGLYVVGGFNWTHFQDDRTSTFHRSELAQDALVFSLSARVLANLGRRARLLLDVGGGYRRVASSARIDGLEEYSMTDGQVVPLFGLGLQFRVWRYLSAGLRAEWQVFGPPRGLDLPLATAGLDTPQGDTWQTNLFVTLSADL